MSPTLSPETQRVLRNHGAVISYAPSRMPAVLSFVLTAALFLGAFLTPSSSTRTPSRHPEAPCRTASRPREGSAEQ